jgi:hypothetical protein
MQLAYRRWAHYWGELAQFFRRPSNAPKSLRYAAPDLADPTAYWLLIAVLQSTVPLEQALAMRLYQAAIDLHRRSENVAKLSGDLAMGEVRRLGRDLLIGAIGGPGFEAELSTPKGAGTVRFILTRQGLEAEEPPVRRGLN